MEKDGGFVKCDRCDINNNNLWRKLGKVIKLNKQETYSMDELAEYLETKLTNPYFQKIKKYLKEKGFIEEVASVGKTSKFKIKNKMLARELRKGEDFKLAGDIIEMTCIAHNY